MVSNRASAKWVCEVHDLRGTEELAEALAQLVTPGAVIALDGDLGAGKTAFSQLFAKHLGVTDTVNSPTFTLIKEYRGRIPFYHMDVYRITLDEADELGLDEYFYGQGVTLVEWSSLITELLPSEHLHLYIEAREDSRRTFHLTATGETYEQWLITLRTQIENGAAPQ